MTRSRSLPKTSAALACATFGFVTLVTLFGVGFVSAQEDAEWRTVDNPYQEDLEYTVGTTFEPGVEVEGVRWRSFKLVPRDTLEVAPGESVTVDLTLDFENRRSKSAKILVILLLEDENGSPLDRVEVKVFKLGGNRLRERVEAFGVSGAVLRDTRRIYAFCEIL